MDQHLINLQNAENFLKLTIQKITKEIRAKIYKPGKSSDYYREKFRMLIITFADSNDNKQLVYQDLANKVPHYQRMSLETLLDYNRYLALVSKGLDRCGDFDLVCSIASRETERRGYFIRSVAKEPKKMNCLMIQNAADFIKAYTEINNLPYKIYKGNEIYIERKHLEKTREQIKLSKKAQKEFAKKVTANTLSKANNENTTYNLYESSEDDIEDSLFNQKEESILQNLTLEDSNIDETLSPIFLDGNDTPLCYKNGRYYTNSGELYHGIVYSPLYNNSDEVQIIYDPRDDENTYVDEIDEEESL